jgi:hypothetical protein
VRTRISQSCTIARSKIGGLHAPVGHECIRDTIAGSRQGLCGVCTVQYPASTGEKPSPHAGFRRINRVTVLGYILKFNILVIPKHPIASISGIFGWPENSRFSDLANSFLERGSRINAARGESSALVTCHSGVSGYSGVSHSQALATQESRLCSWRCARLLF